MQCIEDDLGLEVSKEKTRIATFGKGFNFLGYFISAWIIRMSPMAEENFKNKIRQMTRRNHNLDSTVVEKMNRVIRGTINYFYTPFTTNLGQFNTLDKWIVKRIRCIKYKRIWLSDTRIAE